MQVTWHASSPPGPLMDKHQGGRNWGLTRSWRKTGRLQRTCGWLQWLQTSSSCMNWGRSNDYWPNPISAGNTMFGSAQKKIYFENVGTIWNKCRFLFCVLCFTQASVKQQAIYDISNVETYWVDAKRIRSRVHACDIRVQGEVQIVLYIFRPK